MGAPLRPSPSARTRVVAVIGDPIAHSLSPALHNAGFAAAGLDWVCVAFRVRAGSAAAAVEGVRTLGLEGLSVTMPHKADIIDGLDGLTETASRLGSVNCVRREGDRLVGDSTDGAGFLAGLADDFGLDPSGARCVVLGAGGAARAVVLALADAGAASVHVVNRTEATAARAAALAGASGAVGDLADVGRADLVVNATPVGMAGTAGASSQIPLDPSVLGPHQVVAELVYHPQDTPLMQAARRAGARTSNGVSMLLHQAAVAFGHWTGVEPPVAAMRAAVQSALVAPGEPG